MEEVSLNSSAANLFAGEAANGAARQRDATNESPPEPPPRVNEGPSTVTRISPQALQLVQQERDAGNDRDAVQRPPEPSGSANPPPRNDSRPAEGSVRDDTDRSGGSSSGGDATASNPRGRLVNDPSPNELLRN